MCNVLYDCSETKLSFKYIRVFLQLTGGMAYVTVRENMC